MKVWSSEELIRAARGGSPEVNLEQTAQKLGICQFDLFRQAYSAWYQDGPNDELVGQYFMSYMDHGDMPCWVRLYAEVVQGIRAAGDLVMSMRAVA